MTQSDAPAETPLVSDALLSGKNVLAPAANAVSWRIPAVDGFRALAMLMVIACHAWEFGHHPTLYIAPLGWRMEIFGFFERGSYGVDLFMVLSGFCLFLPLCKSEQALAKFHWKNFYQRRARRIIPPYYAGILFATLMPFALTVFFACCISRPTGSRFREILTVTSPIFSFCKTSQRGVSGKSMRLCGLCDWKRNFI